MLYLAPAGADMAMLKDPPGIIAAAATLARPRPPLALLGALLLATLICGLPRLTLDLSTTHLLADPAPDAPTGRALAAQFQLPDTLTVVVTAPGDIVAADTRKLIDEVAQEIRRTPGVTGVTTILEVPLVTLVRGPLLSLADNSRRLGQAGIDLAAARAELITSPLYRQLLTSADGASSAIAVTLDAGADDRDIDPLAARASTLAAIEDIVARHRAAASLLIGGAAALAHAVHADSRADLVRVPLLCLLAMALAIAAGARRVPLLELACGSYAVLATLGVWGLLGPRLGIFPAALVPLVAVLAVSFSLRLSTAFDRRQPHADGNLAVAVRQALATAVSASAPGSGILLLLGATLILSPVRPLRDCGLLLLCGLACAWLAAFAVGPLVLVVAGRSPRALLPVHLPLGAVEWRATLALMLAVAAIGGLPRFVQTGGIASYLQHGSAEHRAFALIDSALGGGIGFDVLLHLPPVTDPSASAGADSDIAEAFRSGEGSGDASDTWFTQARMEHIKAVDAYLAALPGVGKVTSFATLLEVGRRINGGDELTAFDLNLLYKRLPRAVRTALVDPYVAPAGDAARLHVQMIDGIVPAARQASIDRIRHDLAVVVPTIRFTVTGAYVVYAAVLDHLAPSLAMLTLFGMLASAGALGLRGSRPRAIFDAMLPLVLAIGGVLGVVGWRGGHLDLLGVCAAGIACALYVHILAVGSGGVRALQTDGSRLPMHESRSDGGRLLNAVAVTSGLLGMSTAGFVPAARFGTVVAAIIVVALLITGARAPRSGLRGQRW